jgi:predicted CXXCH cytochrome family protein
MIGNKYLLIVAIIGISIWNIPDTTSIFQGQHTFYSNESGNGKVAPCEKCHQNIRDILSLSETPGEHNKNCRECHTRDGNSSHAASIIKCSKCHQNELEHAHNYNCTICHGSHGSKDPEKLHRTAITLLICSDCHNVHR